MNTAEAYLSNLEIAEMAYRSNELGQTLCPSRLRPGCCS